MIIFVLIKVVGNYYLSFYIRIVFKERIQVKEFKILDKVKWLLDYAEVYMFSSFPKIHLALKIKLEDNMYSLIENCIRANLNKGNIRSKYQKEILTNIALIDYYAGVILDKGIVKKKRFDSFINCLNEIRKMTYGWINNEEK